MNMRYKILNARGKGGKFYQILCMPDGERIPRQLESTVTQTLENCTATIKAMVQTPGMNLSFPSLCFEKDGLFLHHGTSAIKLKCDVLEYSPGGKDVPGYVVFKVSNVETPGTLEQPKDTVAINPISLEIKKVSIPINVSVAQ